MPCDVGAEFLNIIFNKFVFQSVNSSNAFRGVPSACLLAPVKGLMCLSAV